MNPLVVAIQAALGTSLLLGCATPGVPVAHVKPTLAVRGAAEARDYYVLGRHYQLQGRQTEAAQAYRRALAIDASNADAHNGIGTLLASAGDLDRAIEAFEAAIAADPFAAQFHNNLGFARHLQRRYADAVTAFERAVAFDSGNARAWNNLGTTLAASGEAERALAAFARARDLASPPPAAGPGTALASTKPANAPAAREEVRASRVASGTIAVPPPTLELVGDVDRGPGSVARALVDAAPPAVAATPLRIEASVPEVRPAAEPVASALLAPVRASPETPSPNAHAQGVVVAEPGTAAQSARSEASPVENAGPRIAAEGIHPFTVASSSTEAAALAPIELPAVFLVAVDDAAVAPEPLTAVAPMPMTATQGSLVPAPVATVSGTSEWDPLGEVRVEAVGEVRPWQPTARLVAGAIVEAAADAGTRGAPPAEPPVAAATVFVPASTVASAPEPSPAIVAIATQAAEVLSEAAPAESFGSVVTELPAEVIAVPTQTAVIELKYSGSVLYARPAAAADVAPVRYGLEVANGNGIARLARTVAGLFAAVGAPRARLTNEKPFTRPITVIEYREGHEEAALALSARLPTRPRIVPSDSLRRGTDVRLVLGHDVPRDVALVPPQPMQAHGEYRIPIEKRE